MAGTSSSKMTEAEIDKLTVAKLKALLDEKEIAYEKKELKATLAAKLKDFLMKEEGKEEEEEKKTTKKRKASSNSEEEEEPLPVEKEEDKEEAAPKKQPPRAVVMFLIALSLSNCKCKRTRFSLWEKEGRRN